MYVGKVFSTFLHYQPDDIDIILVNFFKCVLHSTEAFTTAREDLGLLVVLLNKGSKERKKKTDRDGWPLTSMEEFVVFAYKIKKEPKSVGYTKMLRIVRKSNLYIYNKHLTDIVCTIPLSTDSQLYLYVWQPRSENVPYFGYSLLDYNCCMFVWLSISQKTF